MRKPKRLRQLVRKECSLMNDDNGFNELLESVQQADDIIKDQAKRLHELLEICRPANEGQFVPKQV